MFSELGQKEPRQWKYTAATTLAGIALFETLFFETSIGEDPYGSGLTMASLGIAAGYTALELYSSANEKYQKSIRVEHPTSQEADFPSE